MLRDDGVALVSTRCSVAECKAFGAICGALDAIGETELATPIGPHLRELAESVFSRFTDELSDRATELSRGGSYLGKLVSNVIVARK